MEPLARAKQGALNLVKYCAEVKEGERVALVHERGRGDPEVAALLAEAVEAGGARSEILWVERLEQGLVPSAHQWMALRSADKVIASTRDQALLRALLGTDKPSLAVANWFDTVDLLGTEHARYHWGMASAIYAWVEELFTAGSRFRISSPSGTSLEGKIGDFSARASYREDERGPDRARNFHSGISTPVASLEAEGQIVVEITGGFKRIPCEDPALIKIADNRIAGIEPTGASRYWVDKYRQDLDEKLERFGAVARIVDSWHGGTHPRAEAMQDLLGNACTAYMHFHLGRTTGKSGDYLSAEISQHTLTVDGRPIYEHGKLMILDDPKIEAVAEAYGLSEW